MSVINQMLRDLDKQQPATSRSLAASSEGQSITLAEVKPGVLQQRWPLLLLLTVVVLISGLSWPLLQSTLPSSAPEVAVVSATASSTTDPSEPEVVLAAQTDPEPAEQAIAQNTDADKSVAENTDPENIGPAQTTVQAKQIAASAPPPAARPVMQQMVDSPTGLAPAVASPTAAEQARVAVATAGPAAQVNTAPLSAAELSDAQGRKVAAGDSEVFAATPQPDWQAQTMATKQPSSMQVEKVVQDPEVLARAQARAQQLQQLQFVLQSARQASQQQQWRQTLQLLQQIPPEFASAESWQLQANARQQLADYPGALASWQQLLQLKPQLAQAWLGKALAHEHLAELAQARAAYQQAYALPGLSAASRQFIQQRLALP